MTIHLDTDDTAACRQPGVKSDWFYDDTHNPAHVARAVNICKGVGGKPPCPFLQPCAEYGIRHERWGIWGGLTGPDRKRIRRKQGIVIPTDRATVLVTHRQETSPAIHGRGSGVYQHAKNDEPLCPACLTYTRERNREYDLRARKRRAS